MRILFAFLVFFAPAVAAQAAMTTPKSEPVSDTTFKSSKNWTLRKSLSEAHRAILVLSLQGHVVGDERAPASLVYYCLEKDYFGISFFVFPDDKNSSFISEQTATYRLRDDVEREMKVEPIGRFKDEYGVSLSHLAPDANTSNLVMIKYPGYALSTLFNMRKGGNYSVKMNDENNKVIELVFETDGLVPLHDTVRKKCGW